MTLENTAACPTNVTKLEEWLSLPSPKAIETLGKLDGDVIILGAGGKMGPTLSRMAKRASDEAGVSRRVIAVSRFSDEAARVRLESWGVETTAGDLLDESFVKSLPDVPNVVHMAGFKFGASQQPWMTWAMNCFLPALVCRKYRNSRIAAFSSGNVYGLVPVDSDGSRETDELNPIGEYAMAALGRERTFEYFSRELDIPLVILRLNYACELRYGVLVDLAQQVWSGRPIDLSMAYFNVIWQGDANAMSLAALAHAASPPMVINIAGADKLRVREVGEAMARTMERAADFENAEGSDAFLSDGRSAYETLGHPQVSSECMIDWACDWIRREAPTLGKPTMFQSRDGKY